MTRRPIALLAVELVFVAALVALPQAYGSEEAASDVPSLSLNGYGTLGVVRSDEDQADFVSSLLAPEGAGHTSEWSAEVDSRLGIQLSSELTPRLSGVVQVVAEQRFDDTYEPALEWANLEYDFTPGLSVRAGRMVQPTFMVSEYRKVGYAVPWVRSPSEVYRIIPVTNFDGIEASYRSRYEDITNTVRATYGRKDSDLPGGGEVRAREGVTLLDTVEWGAATVFASYNSFRLTIEDDEVNALFDGFRQFGPPGRAIADRYDVDDKRFEVIALGARYDPGSWFVMGEWAQSSNRTFIGDNQGWYVTGGYRLGDLTPYATIAHAQNNNSRSDPGLSPEGLPRPEAARALNSALNRLLASGAEQDRFSVGVRWDFTRNADFKVQFDHIDLKEGSPGVLVNTQPGFRPGGSVNLLSVTLDFVF